MSNLELLRLAVLAEISPNQATLSEIKLSPTEPNLVTQPTNKPDGSLFLLPLCFLIIWAAVISIASGIWKAAREEKVTIKHLDQVPCKNCQFFTSNHYLKCAIQPSIALTQEAVNCPDYCPKITE